MLSYFLKLMILSISILCHTGFSQQGQLYLETLPVPVQQDTTSRDSLFTKGLCLLVLSDFDSLGFSCFGAGFEQKKMADSTLLFIEPQVLGVEIMHPEFAAYELVFAEHDMDFTIVPVWMIRIGANVSASLSEQAHEMVPDTLPKTDTTSPENSLLADSAHSNPERNATTLRYRDVIVENMALANTRTMEQAFQEAKRRARSEAVREVVGIRVHSEKFQYLAESDNESAHQFSDFFANINREVSFGQVLDEELLASDVKQAGSNLPMPQFYATVKMRVRVSTETIEPDPGFRVAVSLNEPKTVFQAGEELKLNIKATKDCWVYVFNLLSNDSLIVLFPNFIESDNFFKAGVSRMFPGSSYAFSVSLPPEYEQTHELIYVIATTQNVPCPFYDVDRVSDLKSHAASRFAYIELPRWLAQIRPDQRTDFTLNYMVVK